MNIYNSTSNIPDARSIIGSELNPSPMDYIIIGDEIWTVKELELWGRYHDRQKISNR